jgi:phytol kinase
VSPRELTNVAVAAGLLLAILTLAEVLRRNRLASAEATRKLVHALSGLEAAAFPWLFTTAWSVLALAGSYALLMALTMKIGALPSVHGVQRRTAGGLYYPVAVGVLFAFVGHRPEVYVSAILVLALADPAAALVGRPWGRTRYHLFGGTRSVEGSLAFGLCALVSLPLSLGLLTSLDPVAVLLWSLHVAGLATGLEALSPHGSDNLTIPLGCALALLPVTTGPAPLVGLFFVPLAFVGTGLVLARRAAVGPLFPASRR